MSSLFTFFIIVSLSLFNYYYEFSLSFTEILSIPWVSKAVALSQQRGVRYSLQRIVKGLHKR